MKKILIILIAVLFTIAVSGQASAFFYLDDDRTVTEVVADFYKFMSEGRLEWMRQSLAPEAVEHLNSAVTNEEFGRLGEIFRTADEVKRENIKIFITGNSIDAGSINGDEIKATIKYDYKVTVVKEDETRKETAKDVVFLKRYGKRWFITNIKKAE